MPVGPELIVIAIVLNLPFGAYRSTQPRLSLRWFLAIHVPIPLVILLRVAAGFGFSFVPWLVMGAVAGQLIGSSAYPHWRSRRPRAARADVSPAE